MYFPPILFKILDPPHCCLSLGVSTVEVEGEVECVEHARTEYRLSPTNIIL